MSESERERVIKKYGLSPAMVRALRQSVFAWGSVPQRTGEALANRGLVDGFYDHFHGRDQARYKLTRLGAEVRKVLREEEPTRGVLVSEAHAQRVGLIPTAVGVARALLAGEREPTEVDHEMIARALVALAEQTGEAP